MRRMMVLVFTLVLTLGLAACQTEEQFDLESETEFVVGLEAAYAPFNWSTPSENSFTVPLSQV